MVFSRQSGLEFTEAREHVFFEKWLNMMSRRPHNLLSFNAVREILELQLPTPKGLQEIELGKIIGSVGRVVEFTRNFWPKTDRSKDRWRRMDELFYDQGFEPIVVYKVSDVYFVVDGHHRVSVSRAHGVKTIEAYVAEFPTDIPLDKNDTIKSIRRKKNGETSLNNKQLFYLFVCNFVIFLTGGALIPLLPLYAAGFGATPTIAGFYLAFIYLAIALGTLLTGWLANRLPYKSLFIGAGLAAVLALILHGSATTLWQVVLLTAAVWFCAGIGTALVSILTGLQTGRNHRGKSFGLMFLARPLATVVGGLTAGQLVAWQGYPFLFAVLAVAMAGWPLIALLKIEYKQMTPPPATAPAATVTNKNSFRPSSRLEGSFYLLLLAVLLSTTAAYTGRLGISLSMYHFNFTATAVATTAALAGLATIPLTFVIGTLSDRLGRQTFLMSGYLMAAGGALILTAAGQLWHFWLATVLLLTAISVNGSVAAAFTADLLNPERLGRGLPWLNTITWIGGIVGFAGAGYMFDSLGTTVLYLITALLAVLAAVLVGLLSRQSRVTLTVLVQAEAS